MKNYFAYHPQTGKILRHGTCPDKDFGNQGHDGAIVAEGKITNETHVIDGVPVFVPPPPPTPEEIAAREDREHEMLVRKNLSGIILDFENRLRAREGKPAATKAEFTAALKEKK